ncbi:EAL domain-containing protein [Qipengyuania psychrotolerans]|uniref:EAL domain-containing protein n=1 Tax=Qipengyuania psychrotolerans TaxID=2867238 RepID=A0ABX8ZLM2_9SPHN|nr:EAL domain-containing protein [Qipengyuania psychrotolerans]QZD88083.1 EAL domain-containing protein [Qipengyuania psychrotolerans]
MSGFFTKRSKGKSGARKRGSPPKSANDVATPRSVSRLELLDSFENAGLGWFWASDEANRIIYLSPAALEKLGLTEAEVFGQQLADFFLQDEEHIREGRPLKFVLSARNSITHHPVSIANGGNDPQFYWELTGIPQYDEERNFTGYRGSAKDITSTRASQLDAERMAQYDSLTGLANRHRMSKRLASTLKAFHASQRSCALFMLDLDRFKQVNDTHGHPAGDDLLKQVANRIERIVGNKGEIGRLGGDEFQIMLQDIDDRAELGELADRLIKMISQPYQVNDARVTIGTSVGIAVSPFDGVEPEELIKAADLALYGAKNKGKGCYRFYNVDMRDGAQTRNQIETDLRRAMEEGELRMYYQPIVSAKDHNLKCLEALIRWEHPERGFIPPSQFIPVAEEIGMIIELGDWALREVCREASTWPFELRVAVNVSAIQFAHDDFPRRVKEALQDTGMPAARLELEITESVFVGDAARTQQIFEELKRIGVRLALDDFGTGYSSLSYLQKAPFDKIKIDRAFVQGATEKGNNNPAIMSAIVSLAESLKMETVAEGVETKDELNLVKERGASHIQGFIFSPAIPHDELLERLETKQLTYEARGPERFRAERKSVYRRVGMIHEDHRYHVVMRDLSKTGARVEGLLNVPIGTNVVLDLGGGQLAVATVRRSDEFTQGLEFEMPLISDGSDGLCTRHRVSPYEIASASNAPLASLPEDPYAILMAENAANGTRKQFMEVDISKNSHRRKAG